MRKTVTKELLDNMIIDYHNGDTFMTLSKKYGFQKQTIQKHFKAKGLPTSDKSINKFKLEELNNLITDYNKGLRPYQLAEKYNRDPSTIIGKLQSVGVYQNAINHFSEENIAMLKTYYPIGDWNTISKYLPNVSRSSVHKKMSELGIAMISHRWTKDDVDLLRRNYCSMYGRVQDFIDLFDGKFTYRAILSKAHKLGLKTREIWSENEIDILRHNYSSKTLDEMLILLPKRSRAVIIWKAASLGLENKRKLDQRYTKEQADFISLHYNSMTDKEIAAVISKAPHSVADYRHRHNLLKIHEKSSYNDVADFIRRNNRNWKNTATKNSNYKCVLSGQRFDDIHHIYSLNNILDETFDLLGFEIKADINDYSKAELMDILNCFRTIQATYPDGVCLTKELHTLFHRTYGYGCNTIEQWNEFKDNYTNTPSLLIN